MTIKYFPEMQQGSESWYAARCGLLTASEMKNIITSVKLDYSSSKDERRHLYELAAQRITQYVEPSFQGSHMLRGKEDEIIACGLYSSKIKKTTACGFVTNDKWGFTLGYSPDALIDDDGQFEAKSRLQALQLETILNGTMPDEFRLQVQTGLLVTERKYCEFASFSGGMKMPLLRIEPDEKVQTAILSAAEIFHKKLDETIAKYNERISAPGARFIDTERRKIEEEITI